MIEQMSDIEILQFQRNGTQRELETFREISETIEGSAENGSFWLGTEDPHEFLANYARVGLLKERILKRTIPNLQTNLEELNQENSSAAGTIKFPKAPEIEADEEVERKDREAHIRKFEEDTAGVKFGKMEQRLIGFYRRELLDKEFVSGNVVMNYMWGEGVDRVSKSNRLTVSHVNINKKLAENGWRIKNNTPKGSNRDAQYFFVFIKKEEEESVEEVQFSVEVESKRPVLEINLEKREVKITANGIEEIVRIPEDTKWEIFKVLANNPNTEFTQYSKDLMSIPERAGIFVPHFQHQSVVYALTQLMRTLNIEGQSPIISKKLINKLPTYTFEAEKVTYQETQGIEVAGLSDVPKIEQIGFLGAGEILTIPYEPSEDERRSEAEDRVLKFIVDSFLQNSPLTFEHLQMAAATDKTIVQLPHGLVKVFIYQAHELKDMFSEALRKIREEAVIRNLRDKWQEEDNTLYAALQGSIQKLSGGDISDFQTKVKRIIDNAERRFYNSLPSDQRNRKVLFITVDGKELEGRK